MTTEQTALPSWGILLFRGILAILFGIAAIAYPALTTLWLLRVFAIFLFIDALFLIFALISGKIEAAMPHGLLWVRAILGLVLGIFIVFIKPVGGTLALGLTIAMFMAIEAIIIGGFEVVMGFKTIRQGGFWSILSGIFWIIFAIVLMASPVLSMVTITWVSGIFGIILGVTFILLAFKVKKTKRMYLSQND
ncbi:MAG: HdeD family acid-resistance protein [Alphaproteobacteria bacterium]